jgi:hypothetical protein
MQKVLQVVGVILGWIGTILMLGTTAVWALSPESLLSLNEASNPALWFILAGLGLVVLGALLTILYRTTSTSGTRKRQE